MTRTKQAIFDELLENYEDMCKLQAGIMTAEERAELADVIAAERQAYAEAPDGLWLNEIAPDVDVDYDHHARCERDIIEPALKRLGYTLQGTWFTGDGDSFGPLTRCIHTDKGIVVYG